MINMKLTPEEAKETNGGACCGGDPEQPAYPYGLSISLNDETLAKLGITALPQPGTRMMLQAVAEVTNTSQYENQDGKDRSISLQITDMDLAQDASADPKTLYPNSSMT